MTYFVYFVNDYKSFKIKYFKYAENFSMNASLISINILDKNLRKKSMKNLMEKSNYYNGNLDILSKSSFIRIDLSSFVKVETESGTKTCL